MKDLLKMNREARIEALSRENIIARPAALIVATTLFWVALGLAVVLGVTGVWSGGFAAFIGLVSFWGGVICSLVLPDNKIKDIYFRIEEVSDSGNFKVLRKRAAGDYDQTPCSVKPNGVYVVGGPEDFKNHIMVWGSLDNLRIRLILTDEYRKEIKKAREAK